MKIKWCDQLFKKDKQCSICVELENNKYCHGILWIFKSIYFISFFIKEKFKSLIKYHKKNNNELPF